MMKLKTQSEERIWLVLEDDESVRQVLLTVMKMVWKITPLAFTTGDEVLAWLDKVEAGQASGALPELALLDIRVPVELKVMMSPIACNRPVQPIRYRW